MLLKACHLGGFLLCVNFICSGLHLFHLHGGSSGFMKHLEFQERTKLKKGMILFVFLFHVCINVLIKRKLYLKGQLFIIFTDSLKCFAFSLGKSMMP